MQNVPEVYIVKDPMGKWLTLLDNAGHREDYVGFSSREALDAFRKKYGYTKVRIAFK